MLSDLKFQLRSPVLRVTVKYERTLKKGWFLTFLTEGLRCSGLKENREKQHLEDERGIADFCSSARMTEGSSQKLTNGLWRL
jgi:hypothetical protein